MSAAAPLQNLAAPSRLQGNSTQSSSNHAGLLLQRECACGSATSSLTGECAECKSKKRLQAKLAIGASNDPLEQEADRIADQVMAAPANPAVSGAAPHIQRYAGQPSAPTSTAPASVDCVLANSGRPLEPALRQDMKLRFDRDFSQVRVHTDPAPQRSATDVRARAYTVGEHIVFGPGRFAPHTDAGRWLLAHELVHVAQQGGAATLSHWLQRQPEETAADTPAEAPEEGGLTDSLVQRTITRAARQSARLIRRSLPIPIPETVLAALVAAQGGFLYRSYQRLVEQDQGLRILGRVSELADPRTAIEFYGSYLWGVLKGLVSPVTGLVHLAAAGIQLQVAAVEWLQTLPSRAPELVAEAQAIQRDLEAFSATVSVTLNSLSERDQLLEFAGAIFSAAATASEALEQQLVQAAERQGRVAADSLIDHFLEAPLAELGETAGEIVGIVIIELVLLLFTEGIGNLITKLGEFARALRPLSRGATMFLDVALAVGRIIGEIEHVIGALLSRTVLRPLMPIFEALEPLLGRMRQFAQRLVGMSEGASTAVAGTGARLADDAAARTASSAERAPVRGATAEGVGDEFSVGSHPEPSTPMVERGRLGGRPDASSADEMAEAADRPVSSVEDVPAREVGELDDPMVDPDDRELLSGSREPTEADRAERAARADDVRKQAHPRPSKSTSGPERERAALEAEERAPHPDDMRTNEAEIGSTVAEEPPEGGPFHFISGDGKLLERPPLDPETKAIIEASMQTNKSGQFLDEKGNVIIEPTYGHIYEHENRRILAAAQELELTQAQVYEYVNSRPEFFKVEEKVVNLSHRDEAPGLEPFDHIVDDMQRFFGL